MVSQGIKVTLFQKKDVERKIQDNTYKHEIINVGDPINSNDYISKFVIDITIDVIAREYRFFKDKSGNYNIPKEYKVDVQYGNDLKTLCSVLNTEGIVAINRLTDFVSSISHGKIKISNGTIVNFIKDLSKKSMQIISNITEKVKTSTLMYTDATTARCNDKNISVRNYSTDEYTVLIATEKKSKKYLEETGILNNYTGTICHDHETVMYNYGTKHAECNVHVTRYLSGNYECTSNDWSLDMREFLINLNEQIKERCDKGINTFSVDELYNITKRYDEIINKAIEQNKKVKSKTYKSDELKLINRLIKYKENHLNFVYDFTLPFSNNLSERELRNVKNKQKISGFFKSMKGVQDYLNIKSIITTCKKKALDFYEIIQKIYNNTLVTI